MGDMTPFSQPLPSVLFLARPWILFLRLLDLDKGPRGRAQHTTLAHIGMGTQNILENPKMHLQKTLSQSYVGLELPQRAMVQVIYTNQEMSAEKNRCGNDAQIGLAGRRGKKKQGGRR